MNAEIAIISVCFYLLGQGLLEIGCFILDEGMDARHIKWTYHAGFAWMPTLCLIPLFDGILSLGPARANVVDATVMPTFHYAAYVLVYLWPVVSASRVLIGGYVRLPGGNREERIRVGLERLAQNEGFLFEPSLTLPRLAARLGVSAHQLSYYFNACIGTGFSAWHNKMKIEQAKKILVDDLSEPIIDIAFDCGFGSKTVFNEQFKRLVGMTPTEFRAEKKKEPRPKA